MKKIKHSSESYVGKRKIKNNHVFASLYFSKVEEYEKVKKIAKNVGLSLSPMFVMALYYWKTHDRRRINKLIEARRIRETR